jgi:hypothetical protein
MSTLSAGRIEHHPHILKQNKGAKKSASRYQEGNSQEAPNEANAHKRESIK